MNRLLAVLPFWLLLTVAAGAAEINPLFQSQDPLQITLTGPFRTIDRERDKDQEYEGTVSYTKADGQVTTLDTSYEVRGNYRLRKDVCRFSQLWLDLRRGQLPGTLFEGQNRLKLVVQCRPRDRYADLVVKEHLAYRMFLQLSDTGFDARLVNVTYDYSDDEGESRTHLGVIIEHKDTVAQRAGGENVDLNRISLTDLEPRQATLVGLFMMMIGNTDFSLAAGPVDDECCHNAKLLDIDGRYVPIPYDFDASGFVDASYAADPNPSFGLRSNRQRLFRGYCIHNDYVSDALPVFREAKEAILSLIRQSGLSSPREIRSSVGYIEDFYEIINDPGEIEDEILDDCRG